MQTKCYANIAQARPIIVEKLLELYVGNLALVCP